MNTTTIRNMTAGSDGIIRVKEAERWWVCG